MKLVKIYRRMLVDLVNYVFEKNIDSFIRLKRDKYRELRGKFPQLPSHYIHTVCQDTSMRIKSFAKLKKKGLAVSGRLEVNRISIWLVDHLWRRAGYTAILMFTSWVPVDLKPHKSSGGT
jgi:putative transposase